MVFGDHRHPQLDRSPCGTGTSAKLSLLFSRKELQVGESFIYKSFTGTRFLGRIIATTKVGGFNGIIPEISGTAHLCGEAKWFMDSDDKMAKGFQSGDDPLTTFIIFVSVIIPLGTSVSIAYLQGEGKTEDANKQFSQGMFFSLIFGILLSCLIGLFGNTAIQLLPVSKEVAGYAGKYCTGLILMPFFQFLNIYLYYVYVGQGYTDICILSSAVRLVLNIALDFVLCKTWGT